MYYIFTLKGNNLTKQKTIYQTFNHLIYLLTTPSKKYLFFIPFQKIRCQSIRRLDQSQ